MAEEVVEKERAEAEVGACAWKTFQLEDAPSAGACGGTREEAEDEAIEAVRAWPWG